MQKTRVRRVGALLVGLSLFAAACGDDDDSGSGAENTTAPVETEAPAPEETTPPETTPGETTPPDTPGAECGRDAGPVTDGDLEGFAGATPFGKGGTEADFIARLCEIDGELIDLNYAAESYDAVIITALAMEVAGDDG